MSRRPFQPPSTGTEHPSHHPPRLDFRCRSCYHLLPKGITASTTTLINATTMSKPMTETRESFLDSLTNMRKDFFPSSGGCVSIRRDTTKPRSPSGRNEDGEIQPARSRERGYISGLRLRTPSSPGFSTFPSISRSPSSTPRPDWPVGSSRSGTSRQWPETPR